VTRKLFIACLLFTIILAGSRCEQPATKKTHDASRFKTILENYWQGLMRLQPLDATTFGDNSLNDRFVNNCTQAYRQEVERFYTAYRDSLKQFDPASMNETDGLSYQVLKYDTDLQLEKSKYPTWKIPFTQMGDAGNTLSANYVLAMGQYGSGESSQPFKTVKDYDNWLQRVHGYTSWCDSAIANFRTGMATNYVLPKTLVVKMIDICNGLISAEDSLSIFYGPVKKLPANFSGEDKKRITLAYRTAIKNELNVAHRKLSAFLKNEYLPAARNSSGIGALPDGFNYYKLCVKEWTTTDKTLDEIYNTGLSEVKRIRQEMENIKNSTGFKGELNAFFHYMRTDKKFMPFKTPEQVLDTFRRVYENIKPALSYYFSLFPKSKFEIRQTEAFRAASASIEYLQGTPNGSRPGVFYVPVLDATTFNITSGMESTFLHEAVPGHHYQGSLQMEDSLLPAFRRFKWYGAYGEGWALYCESLGKELGLYKDPYQHMGALGDEIHRAIRLVVDIGIHSRGMSREAAIAYVMANEPVDEHGATAEIERYMANPGQALSYKVGALKIRELREKYSRKMGSKFDIAEFHKQVLNSGCLPLSVMEAKLDRWAQTQ